MRMTILAAAALVLAVSAPVYAADLYSGYLWFGPGPGVECTATNKGTGNVTITVSILYAGFVFGTCGPTVVAPQEAVACLASPAFSLAYCKVTTTNAASTRAVFATLDANGDSTAVDTPR